MMNYIWPCLIVISILFGVLNGRTAEVSDAVFSGAGEAVQLFLTLLGMIALWSGIMKIAEHIGLTRALCKLFSPVLNRLFPGNEPDGPASRAISMNVAANMLGLGNAALPLGLTAMKEMQKRNLRKDVATNDMVMFVVMNTASVQLIPTTVAILRARHGSSFPMEILPSVWVTTVCSMTAGLIVAKLLSGGGKSSL